MPITLDGTNGITTPTYGGADTSEYLVPVTQFKNRIINGAMVIDQRNAGASVTPTTGVYTLDRWFAVAFTASSKFSVQQNAGSVTPPAGFTNYLGVTSLSAYTVSSSDFLCMIQNIEGYNIADLSWGTANAKTVTLSFWVRSSLTGTFGGALANNDGSRSYPFTYTISAANTWEQKSIIVAGDTSGTWLNTNGLGLSVRIGLGIGSTYLGTAGTWAAGANYFSATGTTNLVATNGATLYITGVQLEVGSTATSFDYRPYGTELALCQRYYQTINGGIGIAYEAASMSFSVPYKVTMRSAPTASLPSGTIVTDRAGSGGFTSSGASIVGSSIATNAASLNVTGWSGLTTGWAPLIYQTAAWVNFNAEL